MKLLAAVATISVAGSFNKDPALRELPRLLGTAAALAAYTAIIRYGFPKSQSLAAAAGLSAALGVGGFVNYRRYRQLTRESPVKIFSDCLKECSADPATEASCKVACQQLSEGNSQ